MEKYDYRKEITEAIVNYIKDNDVLDYEYKDRYDLIDTLYDELWAVDDITGNGYDYYDTEDKCSEYLCGNFDLLYEAAREYCIDDDVNILIKHYEDRTLARYFDCTIRCYLLSECIDAALNELKINI